MTRFSVLIAFACACGDNASNTPTDAPITPDTTDAEAALAFVREPVLVMNPSGRAPQSGELAIATNHPTRVSLSITDETRTFSIDFTTVASEHTLPVLGFRPDTTNAITVTVTDERGASLVASLSAVVPPLPAGFPAVTTMRHEPALIEPGITLLGIDNYVLTVEAESYVNWFVDLGHGTTDIRRLANGNIVYSYRDNKGGAEIDMFGNVLRRWHTSTTSSGVAGSIGVATDTMHHELALLPDGNFVTMSTEKRSYANYPTSETDPTPQSGLQDIVGDLVVFFAPDGTIVRTWSMLDILDPYRIGYGSFGAFWNIFYPNALDWSHGNAVEPDPSGGYLISLRHQDAVIKVNDTGELVWILGTHDNWSSAFSPYLLTPIGTPFLWPFHQHAPKVLANGNILIFDNGNFRVSPPAPKPATNYSRAVEYRVDAQTKQIEQTWAFDYGKSLYAPATGDVDIGPVTGNVIITYGGSRRVVEVTHTTPATVVFELFTNTTLYRAERLPSLYP